MRRDQSTVQKGAGKISIHRRTDTTVRDGDVISVCIEDAISGIILIEGQMSLKAFANAVTGFASQPIEMEYTRTPHFGLKCWYEPRSVVIPKDVMSKPNPRGYDYRHMHVQEYILATCQEEGWVVNPYLGSQSSFSRGPNGEDIANYSVHKFIPVDEWDVLDAKRQEEREAERAAAVAAKKKVRKRG